METLTYPGDLDGVGSRIVWARKKAGLDTATLARKLATPVHFMTLHSAQGVGDLKQAKLKGTTPRLLLGDIAEATGVDLGWLETGRVSGPGARVIDPMPPLATISEIRQANGRLGGVPIGHTEKPVTLGTFGAAVRLARHAMGLSQIRLAAQIGAININSTATSISHIEHGGAGNQDLVEKVCRALSLDPADYDKTRGVLLDAGNREARVVLDQYEGFIGLIPGVGSRITASRIRDNLSQQELGRFSSVPNWQISLIERGLRTPSITLTAVSKMAQMLRMTPEELLRPTTDAPPPAKALEAEVLSIKDDLTGSTSRVSMEPQIDVRRAPSGGVHLTISLVLPQDLAERIAEALREK